MKGFVVLMSLSYAGQHNMKFTTAILISTLGATSFFAIESFAQERPLMTRAEHQRMDSLETVITKEQQQTQKGQDDANLRDMKQSRNETKAKAKEAQRVEMEASDAARESKSAYKTERKAQKARKQADRQAQRAAAARNKSNKN
jgi:hypothetical protein